MIYDYALLDLRPGPASRAAALGALADAARAKGDVLLGAFTAQLGWRNTQIAALTRRAAAPANQGDAATRGTPRSGASPAPALLHEHIVSREDHELTATLRPRADEALRPHGIYVHRWFEVDAGAVAEFIGLSGEAWPDFEASFDVHIYGLFLATTPAPPTHDARRRLLLLTHYSSHDVWERSRDPSTTAMKTFARTA